MSYDDPDELKITHAGRDRWYEAEAILESQGYFFKDKEWNHPDTCHYHHPGEIAGSEGKCTICKRDIVWVDPIINELIGHWELADKPECGHEPYPSYDRDSLTAGHTYTCMYCDYSIKFSWVEGTMDKLWVLADEPVIRDTKCTNCGALTNGRICMNCETPVYRAAIKVAELYNAGRLKESECGHDTYLRMGSDAYLCTICGEDIKLVEGKFVADEPVKEAVSRTIICDPDKRHIHADLIHAWAEGAKIQALPRGSAIWGYVDHPNWYEDSEYRIAQTKPSINWEHVHPDYNWMATDKSDRTHLFKNEPVFDDDDLGTWGYDGSRWIRASSHASFKAGTCDWKDSLVSRPGVE